MLIFAGLGNPGAKYAGNRHNIGFMAADEIARRHNFGPWRQKMQAEIAEGQLAGEKILLIKPQTYMNESGRAVGELMRFYKLSPQDIVVFYDELDLVPGKVRVKTGGGSGGHNGIKSIDAHCGKDYHRVRIGIGHPGSRERVHGYVLGDFAKADQEWLDPLLDEISRNADYLARGDAPGFMTRVAEATRTSKPVASETKPAQKSKQKSHIHQARTSQSKPRIPEKGPMADMLKKLFGDKD
ncbi:aminoacyl-tRNA hydrolase [Coralliovum pocilloporae]|uniref:aminoacyl-tRNA hydrolase n=1 Tax=Coralliovum pocilloporae TaxID=3066369 RepID=UPI003306DD63